MRFTDYLAWANFFLIRRGMSGWRLDIWLRTCVGAGIRLHDSSVVFYRDAADDWFRQSTHQPGLSISDSRHDVSVVFRRHHTGLSLGCRGAVGW